MVEQTKAALIIVDVQNDFCEGGSLEVPKCNEIFEPIDKLREQSFVQSFFKGGVVRTRDWHPQNHASFASNNEGSQLFTAITLQDTGVQQVMWPDHCVQNGKGAEFHASCEPREGEDVISKGQLERWDSYSGFGTGPEKTGLLELLQQRGVTDIYCVGLAYDYCVGATALDGVKNGFKTYVVTDATRSVNGESHAVMESKLKDAGVIEITSSSILNQ